MFQERVTNKMSQEDNVPSLPKEGDVLHVVVTVYLQNSQDTQLAYTCCLCEERRGWLCERSCCLGTGDVFEVGKANEMWQVQEKT